MKKSKPLTVRQQIEQCPILTPEERGLALFGLRKAASPYCRKRCNYSKHAISLISLFILDQVPVIKGQSKSEAWLFWQAINNKLKLWFI